MGHGIVCTYPVPMSAGASLSAAIPLGRSYAQVYLAVPGMASFCVTATCNIFVQASADNSTYYRVAYPPPNSSTTGSVDFTLANSMSSRMVPVPSGFQYYKIETSNSMTAAVGFTLVCADY